MQLGGYKGAEGGYRGSGSAGFNTIYCLIIDKLVGTSYFLGHPINVRLRSQTRTRVSQSIGESLLKAWCRTVRFC